MFHRLRTALAAVIVAAFAAFAGSAAAQSSYSFTSAPYDTVSNGVGCTVGDCTAIYTTAMNVTGAITFAAPLAPNLVNADVGAQITAYSFNDGQRFTASTDPSTTIYAATISTDASGLLTNFVFLFERLPGPPYAVNDPGDPNSRFSYVQIGNTGAAAVTNTLCGARGLGFGASAAADPVRACSIDLGGTDRSVAIATAPIAPAPVAVATVPTLSEWAMILFGVILAGGATVLVQRRRLTA